MKIAQIVCTFPPYPGGIGNSAARFAKILNRKFNLTTFIPAPSGQKTREEVGQYGRLSWLKPLISRGKGAVLGSLFLRLKNFDTIYLHYPFFGTAEIVWLFAKLNPKIKLVIHYHMEVKNLGIINRIFSLPAKLIAKSLFKRADLIICGSLDYVKNSEIASFYNQFPIKFQEIPFGINCQQFIPIDSKRPAANPVIAQLKKIVNIVTKKIIKKNRPTLLFVGGLDSAHYFKGVDVLLRSLAPLTENFELQIVGDGNLRPAYKEKVMALGLDKKVKFLGQLNDEQLIKTYQHADLFILPSINRNEAFGLVLIEALSCGLPVIASDLPGVRTVFSNGKEGLLVKAGNEEDLREKIALLLKNEDLRQKMARAARELAENKYDEDKTGEQMIAIFDGLTKYHK